MTHPGSLIRWGALGAVVLLVRAIVRESRAQRTPVILLPSASARTRGSGGRAGAVDLEVADAVDDEAPAAPALEESGPEESGQASGRATNDTKPARE